MSVSHTLDVTWGEMLGGEIKGARVGQMVCIYMDMYIDYIMDTVREGGDNQLGERKVRANGGEVHMVLCLALNMWAEQDVHCNFA